MIKLIIGLSNYGTLYNNNRHNIGAKFLYTFAKYNNLTFKKDKKLFSYISKFKIDNFNVYLLLPTTYINMNGKSLFAVANFYNIKTNEILIIHDELDLPLGKIKFKQMINNVSHNGIKNIVLTFNSNDLYRIKIGIGHPGNKNKVINFLLSNMSNKELKIIKYTFYSMIKNIKHIIYLNSCNISKFIFEHNKLIQLTKK
ncbi:MAG: aminoacyl-tRNA hydrolase [Candidatus Lightella neohaematopini]|nr:aminoacyl-tRNA hydrolase [Candidatus Lightella neohaematopini]MCV2529018.1 aminoacyl-tRNA hydrolase [Candidatus Lightella neohaematopini]